MLLSSFSRGDKLKIKKGIIGQEMQQRRSIMVLEGNVCRVTQCNDDKDSLRNEREAHMLDSLPF